MTDTDILKLIIVDVASLAFLITIIIILLILKHKENKKNMNEESKTNIGQIEPSGNDLINKELAPLKALETIKNAPTIYVGCGSDIYTRYSHECKLIETALKDYEKKTKLAKEYADVNNVAKRLKALEIIKNKRVNVRAFLKCCQMEDGLTIYNNQCDDKQEKESKELTQEEYDLLKEVLL